MTGSAAYRGLLATTALLALGGVAALLWPARPAVPAPPLVLGSPPSPLPPDAADTAAPDDSALAAAVVQANIFSDTRRPPAVRYDPGGMAGGAEGDVAPPPAAAAPAGIPGSADAASDSTGEGELAPASPVPHLYGVVSDPRGPVALLRLDPKVPGARAYHTGDRGGAYRVVRIGDGEVDVDGPGGRRTLRLAGAARPHRSPEAPRSPR